MTLAEIYMEKGKKEGKIEGKQEAKIEVAKNLLAKGFSLKDISEVTGLEQEKVERIKREIKE